MLSETYIERAVKPNQNEYKKKKKIIKETLEKSENWVNKVQRIAAITRRPIAMNLLVCIASTNKAALHLSTLCVLSAHRDKPAT